MLGNDPFYHKSLRKSVIVFGTIFNEIYLIRTDNSDNEVERIKVPIAYGPKEKYIVRMYQDPDLQRPIEIQIPRMSFQITSIAYDGTRKRNKIRLHTKVKDEATLDKVFDGVPYRIGIELTIIAKQQDDANQILEQILPFFTPDFTPTYNPLPDFNFKEDIPITLSNVNYSDNYDDEWRNRRQILYTLNFDVLTYFYGQIKEQGVIKKTQVDLLIAPGDGPVTDEQVETMPRSVRITTTPDPITADANDDYGYTQDIEEFTDGKKYNPITGSDEDIS